MATKQLFGKDAREALRRGAEQIYLAVSCTMGAKGRNVVRQNFGQPKITNDGVTVANSIVVEDSAERQGADLLKEAARTTVTEAGDGTTGAIVLAYTLFKKGLELIENGMNAVELRRMIETEAEKVLSKLKEMAIPVRSDEDLDNIASISIENPAYGKIVAKAVKTSGKDGIVLVEEDYKPGIQTEEVHGYQFDRGLEIPALVGDASRMTTTFPIRGEEGKPVPILVADKSWNLIGDLLPLFEEIKQSGNSSHDGGDKLVIIAEEITGQLAQFLVINRLQQRFHAVVVKPPFNKDMLEDIAALTGAMAITNLKGIVNVKKSHLGWAKKVIVTANSTTIIGGEGDATKLIDDLREQLKDETLLEHQKTKLQERLAKLTGKTVILKVGADTEAEARYLKDKLDDAVSATKAAVEEGIVPGGGMALYRIAKELYSIPKPGAFTGLSAMDSTHWLMGRVLNAPVDKIIENAGVGNTEEIYKRFSHSETSGYDALRGEVVENIVKAGIIDPAKVVRCQFKNAVSLGCMLLTIEALVAEIPQNPNEAGNR